MAVAKRQIWGPSGEYKSVMLVIDDMPVVQSWPVDEISSAVTPDVFESSNPQQLAEQAGITPLLALATLLGLADAA